MLALNADSVIPYLKSRPGMASLDFHMESLPGGVSANVFLIRVGDSQFILKQACELLRVQTRWQSDPTRVDREFEFLKLFSAWLPADFLTKPLWHDADNHILAMTVAPPPATTWKTELLQGIAETARARQAGNLLASLHFQSLQHLDQLGSLTDKAIFHQLRIEPFYDRLAPAFPDLGPRILELSEHLLQSQQAICHGDFSPKNLLLHPDGMTLVDHETAHLGDPAMDLGFFLAHLTLKAIHAGEDRRLYSKLLRAFLASYFEQGGFREVDFQRRSLGHLGVVMLTRVVGTSRVDYLSDAQKDEAKQLAIASLQSKYFNWRHFPPTTW